MSPCQRGQTSSSCWPSGPACFHPPDALTTLPPRCPDFNNPACSWPGSSLDVLGWWLLVNSFSDEWQLGKEANQRDLSGLTIFKSSASAFVSVAFITVRIGIRYQTRNRLQTAELSALALLQCSAWSPWVKAACSDVEDPLPSLATPLSRASSLARRTTRAELPLIISGFYDTERRGIW